MRDNYFDIPAMSQSTLKQGRKSMAALRDAQLNGIKVSPAMELGSAVHLGVLEPHLAKDEIIVSDVRRGTKAWKALIEEHPDKIVLKPKQHEKYTGMVEAVQKYAPWRVLSSYIQCVEQAAFGRIGSLLCKGKCDALTCLEVIDLKTVNEFVIGEPPPSEDKMLWLCKERGYDIQAAMYCELFDRPSFRVVFICSDSPWCADVVLPRDMIEKATDEMLCLIDQYQQCLKTDVWPEAEPEVEIKARI